MGITSGIPNTKPYYTEVLSAYFPFTNLVSVAGWGNIATGANRLVTNCVDMTLPYPYPVTPIQISVSSTSNDDSGSGTGARLIVFSGLDENWNISEELLVMNGQTPVLTANTYLRSTGVAIISYGSNVNAIGDSSNVGRILFGYGTVTAGVPQYVLDCINISDTTGRTAIFTIPNGFTGYIDRLTFFNEPRTNNLSMEFKVYIKFNLPAPLNFHGIFNPIYVAGQVEDIKAPILLPGKTDIQVRAYNNKNQDQLASSYMLIELRENKT